MTLLCADFMIYFGLNALSWFTLAWRGSNFLILFYKKHFNTTQFRLRTLNSRLRKGPHRSKIHMFWYIIWQNSLINLKWYSKYENTLLGWTHICFFLTRNIWKLVNSYPFEVRWQLVNKIRLELVTTQKEQLASKE